MTDDLRYPVGRHQPPTSVWTDAQRTEAIDTIAALPTEMAAAVAGLSDAQLDTPYRPGGWTVRQVVHHVADSHLNAFIRTRWALTEDNPTIKPYDQDAWAGLFDTRTMPVGVSLAILDGLHARWVTLLRSLTPKQFERTVMHPENGVMSIDAILAMYEWHGRHHVEHIKRQKTR